MRQSPHSYNTDVSPPSAHSGDECARFIGHLALGMIACHLQDIALAKTYVAQAHSSIARLAEKGFTVRHTGPMKMVRVVTESSGLSETILLPVLDDVLLLPRIDFECVVRAVRTSAAQIPIVNYIDIAITYHSLRLRTGRLSHAMEDLANMDSPTAIAAALQDMLDQCLHPTSPSPGTLDVADDYLMLTLTLARQKQCALAGMALAKAKEALLRYGENTNLPSHPKRVARLTTQLASMADTLAAMAS